MVEDIHDLPKRFWATPALVIEENEMDAIMVRLEVDTTFMEIEADLSFPCAFIHNRAEEQHLYRNDR